jgi:hypothetical protein
MKYQKDKKKAIIILDWIPPKYHLNYLAEERFILVLESKIFDNKNADDCLCIDACFWKEVKRRISKY